MPEATAILSSDSNSATSIAFIGEGKLSHNVDETIAIREKFLTEYQDSSYASKYTAFVKKVRAVEAQRTPGFTGLSEAVARYAFKLMAYKDEYEVARLYSTGDFEKRIRDTFDGDFKLHLNLAPPMFSKRDSQGHLVKREFGPWVFTAFKVLKRLKFLRGTAFDVFGKTDERRMERRLIADYFATIETLLSDLSLGNHVLAVEIARIPEHIRGYGHVKETHLAAALEKQAALLARWRNPMAADQAA